VIDKRTVFVLGAGASCPYGYPSGTRLRELICFHGGSFKGGFLDSYLDYLNKNSFDQSTKDTKMKEINKFIKTFKSAGKSVDVFMANNPKFAPTGKYIIAFEIIRAERESCFGEDLKRKKEQLEDALQDMNRKKYLRGFSGFQGDDWYSYFYDRITSGLIGKDALPDFSNDKISFITFNYDRSLEQFFYESLSGLFSEVKEERIVQTLKQLKILHVYGQIAPLKWQNPSDYADYKPKIDEPLLLNAVKNIRTIYEEKQNPELTEAHSLIKQSEQVFFLGFGYAPENMQVLALPSIIPETCLVYGTAFGANDKEVERIHKRIIDGDSTNSKAARRKVIEPTDCLELLRNYLG
jgi:hypothetical protein